MKKKTNLALVAVLLCSVVLMSLFGSCSKEQKRADLDIDRLHNIFVSSESMLLLNPCSVPAIVCLHSEK